MGEAKATKCSEDGKPYTLSGCVADSVTADSCKDGKVTTKGVVTFCQKKIDTPDKDLVKFEDAQKFCEERGLRLVEPSTPAKAAALNQLCDGDGTCTWLGMTCTAKSDECAKDYASWKWTRAGQTIATTHNSFLPPKLQDGAQITGGSKEKFCSAHKQADGANTWYPYKCDGTEKKFGAACEVYPTPVTKKKCSGENTNIKEAGGMKFCYKKGKTTYSQAKKFCDDMGMQLVEPTNAAKIAAVDEFCKADCAWIGVQCVGDSNACGNDLKQWTWVTSGFPLEKTMHKFTKPDGGVIDGHTVGNQCAYYAEKDGTSGKWSTKKCEDEAGGVVCEPRA